MTGKREMAAAMAGAPHPEDLVIEEEGARVFVDADLGPHVSGMELSADTNADGRISLRLEDQA